MAQVDVVHHFNEDGFSFGLAQGLADRLKEALAGVRCAEHGEEPTVRLRTEGVAQAVNDIHVDVTGCCDRVVEEVQRVVDGLRGPDEPAA